MQKWVKNEGFGLLIELGWSDKSDITYSGRWNGCLTANSDQDDDICQN